MPRLAKVWGLRGIWMGEVVPVVLRARSLVLPRELHLARAKEPLVDTFLCFSETASLDTTGVSAKLWQGGYKSKLWSR